MSPRFDINIVWMPNAADGPPHVGHLWSLLHSRYVYQMLCEENERGDALWLNSLNPGWRIAFDVNSLPQHEGAYVDMASWLTGEDHPVDHIADWSTWRLGALDYLLHQPRRMPKHNTLWTEGEDPTGVKAKLRYMNANHVYWHLRGTELLYEERTETALAKELNLRRPDVHYVPLLLDGRGGKISATKCDEAYMVMPLMSRSPRDVVDALMRSVNARAIMTKRMHASRFADSPASLIDQFYPDRPNLSHAWIDEQITVPRGWFDDLKPRVLVAPKNAAPVLIDAPTDADIHGQGVNHG